MTSFGKQLKEKRLEHQLTQEQLAEKIFVSRQAISSWENDKRQPDLENLIMLSELYKTSLDVLLKGEEVEMKKTVEPQRILAPTRKFVYILLLWSIFVVALQIITQQQQLLYLTLYYFGGFLITACSLWRTKRLSNLYSQGENMYDFGIYLCAGFLILFIFTIGAQGFVFEHAGGVL